MLAEIGVDMSVFDGKTSLSWLTPQNNESAGKKKTTRISHGGTYIKPLLVQFAVAVSNQKNTLKSEIAIFR